MSGSKVDNTVYTTAFTTWDRCVGHLLDAAGLVDRLSGEKRVIIKPNLVEPLDPPITTPVELVAAITGYLSGHLSDLQIIVGEGCGSLTSNTMQVFEAMGYSGLESPDQVTLMDLNEEELVHLQDSSCSRWPEMFLPRIALESFLISVPVLKAHSLAGATLTMKNMMGLAPPAHYQQGGHWKKASFHENIQEAVFDLNRYRKPDFTVLDATVGMQEAHLWGPTCDPPPNRIGASFDPVAIDAYGCSLLSIDWRSIGHIAMADGRLGTAAPLTLVEI